MADQTSPRKPWNTPQIAEIDPAPSAMAPPAVPRRTTFTVSQSQPAPVLYQHYDPASGISLQLELLPDGSVRGEWGWHTTAFEVEPIVPSAAELKFFALRESEEGLAACRFGLPAAVIGVSEVPAPSPCPHRWETRDAGKPEYVCAYCGAVTDRRR